MRLKLLCTSLFVLFLSLSSVHAGTISKPPYSLTLNSGLVGHWTFDGANITNGRINDISGQGNHGNPTNIATSTFYAMGKVGQGARFDGVDDRVSTASDFIGTNPFTFSAWVNLRSAGQGTGGRLFSNGNTVLRTNSTTGQLQFTNNNFGASISSGVAVTLNMWNYVVVSRNTSNEVNFYVNGQQIGTLNGSPGSSPVAGSSAVILGNIVASTVTMNGTLDDVRIYNRVLTATEITQLYSFGASKLGVTKTPTTLQSGLVGHWTFDGKDMSSGVARDISGNGNHGNVSAISTSTFYTTGEIGQGLKFDGVNDLISIPSITFGAVSSYSFWIKVPPTTGIGAVIRFSSVVQCRVGANNAETMGCYADGGSGGAANSTGIRTGTWKHAVYVIDTSNTQRLYIDSVLQSTATETSVSGATAGYIGSTGTGGYFNGVIDDVRIYDRVLTVAEITELYSLGVSKLGVTKTPTGLQSGLVGHWTFDGKDMSSGVARDVSGQGNNGNTVNIATSTFYTVGKIGQGVKFDGVDDELSIADSANIRPAEITMSFWIKLMGSSVNILDRDAANAGYRIKCTVSTPCTPELIFNVTFGASAPSLPLNRWVHLVWVGNSSGTRFYTNGVAGTLDTDAYVGTSGTTPLRIGTAVAGTMNAVFDDLRIYNRVLTASEILQLYNTGR